MRGDQMPHRPVGVAKFTAHIIGRRAFIKLFAKLDLAFSPMKRRGRFALPASARSIGSWELKNTASPDVRTLVNSSTAPLESYKTNL